MKGGNASWSEEVGASVAPDDMKSDAHEAWASIKDNGVVTRYDIGYNCFFCMNN